jgi:predicted P-loop ATPase
VIEAQRECVFVGTVNKDSYLSDETGGRRFWPVKCGVIKIVELERDRDQLWAEARERYRAKDTWWLDKQELLEAAADEVEARYHGDPWDETISEWLKNPKQGSTQGYPAAALTSTCESVTVTDILIHCIGKRPDTWTQTDQTRVARLLTSKGWERYQHRILHRRQWRYRKSPVSPQPSK